MFKFFVALVLVCAGASVVRGQPPQAPPVRPVCNCPAGCQCYAGGTCTSPGTCSAQSQVSLRIIQAPPVRVESYTPAVNATRRYEYVQGYGYVWVTYGTTQPVNTVRTTTTHVPASPTLPQGVWAEDGKLWRTECTDGRCRRVQYVP